MKNGGSFNSYVRKKKKVSQLASLRIGVALVASQIASSIARED